MEHPQSCPPFKEWMEETEDYDLFCFCCAVIGFMSQAAFPAFEPLAKELLKTLNTFHYYFYAPEQVGDKPGFGQRDASDAGHSADVLPFERDSRS